MLDTRTKSCRKMEPIVKNASHAMKEIPQQENLVNWLNTPRNQDIVIATIKNSQCEVQDLNDARRVKPEQLHVPITL